MVELYYFLVLFYIYGRIFRRILVILILNNLQINIIIKDIRKYSYILHELANKNCLSWWQIIINSIDKTILCYSQ